MTTSLRRRSPGWVDRRLVMEVFDRIAHVYDRGRRPWVELLGLLGRFAQGLLVVGLATKLIKDLKVLQPPGRLRDRLHHGPEGLEAPDDLLRRVLVVPEARPGHPALDPLHLLLARREVKESPGSPGSGPEVNR